MASKKCMVCLSAVESHNYFQNNSIHLSQKLFSNCVIYLHTAITNKDHFKNVNSSNHTQNQINFCEKCFKSATQLTTLAEQLTNIQKDISDLSMAFSVAALHRRSRDQQNTTAQKSKQTTIELDICDLPVDLFSLHTPDFEQSTSQQHHNMEHSSESQLNQEMSENSCNTVEEIKIEDIYEDEELNDDQYLDFEEETGNNEADESAGQYYETSGAKNINNSSMETENRTVHPGRGQVRVEPVFSQSFHGGNKIAIPELMKSVQLPQVVLDGIQADARRNNFNEGTSSSQSVGIFPNTSSNISNYNQYTQRSTERYVPIFTQGNIQQSKEVVNSPAKTTTKTVSTNRVGHRGEPQGECDICGKQFSRKSLVKAHRRIHTGEKPYKCKYCDKTFTETGNRAKHQKNHERKSSDDIFS